MTQAITYFQSELEYFENVLMVSSWERAEDKPIGMQQLSNKNDTAGK